MNKATETAAKLIDGVEVTVHPASAFVTFVGFATPSRMGGPGQGGRNYGGKPIGHAQVTHTDRELHVEFTPEKHYDNKGVAFYKALALRAIENLPLSDTGFTNPMASLGRLIEKVNQIQHETTEERTNDNGK